MKLTAASYNCETQEFTTRELTDDEYQAHSETTTQSEADNERRKAQRELDLELLEDRLGADGLAALLRVVGVAV